MAGLRQTLARITTHRKCAVLVAIILSLQANVAIAESHPWVTERLNAMSTEQKIGQLLMIDVPGDRLDPATAAMLKRNAVGGVILFRKNLRTARQTKALIRQLQNSSIVNTGTPLLMAVDQEGGIVDRIGPIINADVTKFGARTVGKVYERKPKVYGALVHGLNYDIGKALNELGFNINLAPVLDSTNDPASYIYSRSFSGNPATVANVSRKFVRAMRAAGLLTTGKHFPNLSHTRIDSHTGLPILNRNIKDLKAYEFVPFLRLRREVDAMMVGHVLVPAVDKIHPASLSPKMIRILRKTIGFKGLVISDDLSMGAISKRYALGEAAVRAVHAGTDILIITSGQVGADTAMRGLKWAVAKGIIPIKRIDDAVRRILTVKHSRLRDTQEDEEL